MEPREMRCPAWFEFCKKQRAMTVRHPNELPAEPRPRLQRDVVPALSGHEPMTLAQASYLMMLCEETGEVLDDSLSRNEAYSLIQRLEIATGRKRVS
jgi:hypothetical protein